MEDYKPLVNEKLRDRFIYVINELTAYKERKYAELERETGVPAERWRQLCFKKQMPTLEMAVALAQTRPWIVIWLLTGLSDQVINEDPTKKGVLPSLLRKLEAKYGFAKKHWRKKIEKAEKNVDQEAH